MKRVNFWKTLFFSVLAAAAFTGCSNDDSDDGGTSGIPSITVNGANSTSVAVKLDGGDTPEVQIVSSGNWTLSVEGLNGAVASDCTPSLTSGGKGTATVKFNVKSATEDRTFVATVTTTGKIPGVDYETSVSAKITINQTNALYMENCGTDVEKNGNNWPYTDQFTGWTKGGILDQSGVSYSGNKTSVADSGKNFAPTEAEQAVVSGAPYASMNAAEAKFYINDVNIGTSSNFTFTFTTIQQTGYSDGSVFGAVTDKTIRFAVSVDGGTEFMPAAYTVDQIAKGNWYLCTAEFKLPAGTSTDKLSFRFDNYAYSDQHGLRLDDFKLVEGGNGSELAPAQTTTVTIADISGVGAYEVVNAKVVGACERGFVISDGTGVMFVYKYNSADPVTLPAIGNTVTVSGDVESYGSAYQFSNPEVTVTDAGTDYEYPIPTAVTAENIESIATGKPQYVKVTGELYKDGNYYNFRFLFDEGYSGSVAYPSAELVGSSLDKTVDMEGWYVYTQKSKYFYIVLTKISESSIATGSFTTTPTTFAATDPQPQVLNFTASASAGTVQFEITGTDADKFTYSDQTASTVKVKAVGNNESEAAYTAVLTMKSEAGDVLASVDLRQAAPATGDEGDPYLWTLASGILKQAGGTAENCGTPAMNWTYSAAGYIGFDTNATNRGAQIGSSKAPALDGWSIATEDYTGKISKIVVNACTGGAATLIVTIGDTQIDEKTLTEDSTDYVFEPASSMSGKITISMKATSKAMYLKSIAINPAE